MTPQLQCVIILYLSVVAGDSFCVHVFCVMKFLKMLFYVTSSGTPVELLSKVLVGFLGASSSSPGKDIKVIIGV